MLSRTLNEHEYIRFGTHFILSLLTCVCNDAFFLYLNTENFHSTNYLVFSFMSFDKVHILLAGKNYLFIRIKH